MDGAITDQEFTLFQRLIYKLAGISLSDAKRVLLVGRLSKRLKHYRFDTFSQYYRLLASGDHPQEVQQMVDLLTTNETYFFRESAHFDFLRDRIIPHWRGKPPFRVWSGASSSGEEAYTIAMVLAEHLPNTPWEIFGSDISMTVLAKAAAGLYPLERIEGIPEGFLKKYCLKGVRAQEGYFLIRPELRQRVRFEQLNLTLPIAGIGDFDVIFLRNVMIYFDAPTKRQVIANMLPALKPDGHFIVGHSESLNGLSDELAPVKPTIYQRKK
jgi:chemotaxis protein methyltransferase CheR